jgi:hypothetical protein
MLCQWDFSLRSLLWLCRGQIGGRLGGHVRLGDLSALVMELSKALEVLRLWLLLGGDRRVCAGTSHHLGAVRVKQQNHWYHAAAL